MCKLSRHCLVDSLEIFGPVYFDFIPSHAKIRNEWRFTDFRRGNITFPDDTMLGGLHLFKWRTCKVQNEHQNKKQSIIFYLFTTANYQLLPECSHIFNFILWKNRSISGRFFPRCNSASFGWLVPSQEYLITSPQLSAYGTQNSVGLRTCKS
jgi:hypothetical protein